MSEEDYQKETLFRVVIFLAFVVAIAGAVLIMVYVPPLPVEEVPEPVEPHMSPLPPRNETVDFWSLGAESLLELLPALIGGAIFVLASLVVLFYKESRKEKEAHE